MTRQGARGSGAGDEALDRIETQSAVLVRNFELLRRRGGAAGELDRAYYLLLSTLDAQGASDIGTLAGALGLDPSTVGRQVAGMAADGLVRRGAAAEDRRRSVVTATAAGIERMRATRRRRRRDVAELLEGWSAADLQTLAEMFSRYNTAVTEKYVRRHRPE